jgi:NAD(P)H dehydrogenase (quinone)
VAGANNDRPLSDDEKKLAFAQGQRLAQMAVRLAAN